MALFNGAGLDCGRRRPAPNRVSGHAGGLRPRKGGAFSRNGPLAGGDSGVELSYEAFDDPGGAGSVGSG